MLLSTKKNQSSAAGKEISVVIPVFNEAESIGGLIREIQTVCKTYDLKCEVVVVNDGSTDGTWEVISRMAAVDTRIKGIRMARRFGKACALNAGFQVVTFDTVIQMDGDLQDDPAEIPSFINELDRGFDVVCGYKKRRFDPLNRVIGSRIFNSLISIVSGVKLHDHNCGYKAYRKPILSGLNLYGEMHRHIPLILSGRGARISEVVVNHRPRMFGASKFGVGRIFKGLMDLLTVIFLVLFRQRPLHFLGGAGLIMFGLGFFGLAYLATQWVSGTGIGQRPLLIYSSSALILGFQFFATGILAELLTFYLMRPSKAYFIAEKTSDPLAAFMKRQLTAEADTDFIHPEPDHSGQVAAELPVS